MPKHRLYFLLRANPEGTLSYMLKRGEWPEPPSDVESESDDAEANPDRTRPFTHRFRARSNDSGWRMYLVKLVPKEERSRRRFLGEKRSERRVQRWVARRSAELRRRYGAEHPTWVLAVNGDACAHVKIV